VLPVELSAGLLVSVVTVALAPPEGAGTMTVSFSFVVVVVELGPGTTVVELGAPPGTTVVVSLRSHAESARALNNINK